MAANLNQFLMLYLWFPLAALLLFAFLIARFFERFSNERTFANGFLVAIVVYGVAIVRYASIERMRGDIAADVLLGLGGVLIFVLSLRLYWLMVHRRREDREG